jgi:hypothetical protein
MLQVFRLIAEECGVRLSKTLLMLVQLGHLGGGAELFVVVFASKLQPIVTFIYENHEDRSLQIKPLHS